MSTDHAGAPASHGAHDHYDEYGPTPPGAQYEHTDIDPGIGYKFALWLVVAMVLSFGIVYGTFVLFESREVASNRASQQYPLAAGVTREQPRPALQTQPFLDIYQLREGESQKLGHYGWVDKEGGVTRIPIDRAMELMIQRGFAVRPEGGESMNGDGRSTLNVITQDSSSGRTVAPR